MKRVVAIALMLGVLGWTATARAVIGTIDQVPAATVLLPYFEVDLDNPNGVQTLFSINNASASATLTTVTIWSDLSVPVLFFNMYLTGYDVQTINLRDILVGGVLPRTAPPQQDTGENEPNPGPTPTAISNQGAFSQDQNFPNCQILPLPNLQTISAQQGFDYIAHLQNALTGQPSQIFSGKCAGQHLGDRIARGYITVDSVNTCSLLSPADVGYFIDGGLGIANNHNVLWGDYFYVNSGENFAQGEMLVHIEAAPGTGTSAVTGSYFTPLPGGSYTFYGRYVPPTGADNREPLATNFGTRFLNGGAFNGGTSLIVWRDSKTKQGPFTCPATKGVRPPWYPLGQEAVVIFDEQENPNVPATLPIGPTPPFQGITPFPAEANRTQVGGPDLSVPFDFGWLYLNLNTAVSGPGSSFPPLDPTVAQAWVQTVHDAEGRFSVGYNAIQLDNANTPLHFQPGP